MTPEEKNEYTACVCCGYSVARYEDNYRVYAGNCVCCECLSTLGYSELMVLIGVNDYFELAEVLGTEFPERGLERRGIYEQCRIEECI